MAMLHLLTIISFKYYTLDLDLNMSLGITLFFDNLSQSTYI